MKSIRWSPDMCLGVPRLDAGHQSFLEHLEQVRGSNGETFELRFRQLVASLERDFRDEEALMEEVAYQELHEHREQHARVLHILHQVMGRVLQGDQQIGREAVVLLAAWFVQHFSTLDTAFALTLELMQPDTVVVPERPVE